MGETFFLVHNYFLSYSVQNKWIRHESMVILFTTCYDNIGIDIEVQTLSVVIIGQVNPIA